MSNLSDFIEYLKQQIGEVYCWGCQHTKLTPTNYKTVIHKHEKNTGGYDGGPTYEQAVIDYCDKQFAKGKTVLYAYDCSGLGVFWLTDLKHIWKSDASSNTMMSRCSGLTHSELPKKGWWCFKCNSSGKATHIGYMIDNTYLVEAKGRKYGVCKTQFKKTAWTKWGIPDCFKSEIDPQPKPPEPEPPEPQPTKQYVVVVGNSVRVRAKASVLSKTLYIAHKGDEMLLIDMDKKGWYHVESKQGEAYISSKPKYTKVVEK